MIHKKSFLRVKILAVITIILMACIGIKLGYSCLFLHNELSSLADAEHERSFPLKAKRGIIYDIKNKPLTYNESTLSMYAIPNQIKDKEYVSKVLGDIFNADKDYFYNKINQNVSIVNFPTYGNHISTSISKLIIKENLKGIYLVDDSKRTYPYKESLSSLLGFVGKDNQGLAGLESYYEKYLAGKKGYLNYLLDAKGGLFPSTKKEIIAPSDGMNLVLTLNLDLQNILYRELLNAYKLYNPEEIMGLIMNPQDGSILAICNLPTYDNNDYQKYDASLYNHLLPLYNSYEPGSTFKAITFASALNEKVIDMYNDTYYDKGYEIVEGRTIKSWKKGGHGLQTFLQVLQNSSNPGFVEISRRLGKDKLYNYIKNFGFLEKTNVDIQGENKGIFFSYDNFNLLEQATTSFGQGISVTAIQLVRAFCAVINGGYLYQPYIVKKVVNPLTSETIYQKNNIPLRQVISEETSFKMREALESVVAKGTGRKAYVDGYRVGGKTGTSQIAENGAYLSGQYILSFIAGAPMNNPEIVCYIAMKKPHNCIQYGGTTVGPIISKVIENCLQILKVEKNYDGIQREYTWMDTKAYPVDNFIGKDKNSVKSKYFTFVFSGDGNKVIDQLPRVGEMLSEGSVIMIQLG